MLQKIVSNALVRNIQVSLLIAALATLIDACFRLAWWQDILVILALFLMNWLINLWIHAVSLDADQHLKTGQSADVGGYLVRWCITAGALAALWIAARTGTLDIISAIWQGVITFVTLIAFLMSLEWVRDRGNRSQFQVTKQQNLPHKSLGE